MTQLKTDQLASVFGNLALSTGQGTSGERRARRIGPRGIVRGWGTTPSPFSRRAERIVHISVWAYTSLAVAITIIHNAFH